MKLAIFGATGTVGQNIVEQALKLGHEVIAHTRSPEKLNQHHVNLKLVIGDVLDMTSVEKAVAGTEAVICALGMPLLNKEGVRAKGTKNIIAAMEAADVKRFVCLSGFGAGESRLILPFHFRYIIFPLMMRHLYADHERQESYVKASKLDWTLVRPGSFVKGEHTGKYQHGFTVMNKSIKVKISHADVADFMLKQLTDNTYVQKAASLSY